MAAMWFWAGDAAAFVGTVRRGIFLRHGRAARAATALRHV